MTIHEIKNPLPVHTPHGSGKALFIYDYSIDINSVFGVRLDESGKYKHYYSERRTRNSNTNKLEKIIYLDQIEINKK
jgi:hypothetical protein